MNANRSKKTFGISRVVVVLIVIGLWLTADQPYFTSVAGDRLEWQYRQVYIEFKPPAPRSLKPWAEVVSSDTAFLRLRLYLSNLISTHPRSEIRQGLNDRIRRGRVRLQVGNDSLNQSGIWFRYQLADSSYLLQINYSQFMKETRVVNLCQLWHEYYHVLQADAGHLPKSFFSNNGKLQPLNQQEIELLFAAELEAYQAACRLSDQLTMQDPELDLARQNIVFFVNQQMGEAGLRLYAALRLAEDGNLTTDAIRRLRQLSGLQ